MDGRVEQLWTAPEGSAPMEAREAVDCAPGGIRGDRYFTGRGYYSGFDDCEVTFVDRAAIEAIHDTHGIDLSDGRHRRNVVVDGADLDALLEARFAVGGATFEGTRPRPPCAHVEQVAGEDGLAGALRDRGGICAAVVEAGRVAVGDGVEVIEDRSGAFEAIVDRLRE